MVTPNNVQQIVRVPLALVCFRAFPPLLFTLHSCKFQDVEQTCWQRLTLIAFHSMLICRTLKKQKYGLILSRFHEKHN